MIEIAKEDLVIIAGAEAVALAEQVKWHGDVYTHPKHGACAATFFRPSQYGKTEIVCLYRSEGDTQPVAYGIL